MLFLSLLAALGVGAGVLSTLAGVGGSLFVVLVISTVYSPDLALAVTAPALLIGNAHRLYLFRRALGERDVKRRAVVFSLLAAPAAFVGGLLATEAPEDLLRGLLLGVLALAIARETGLLRFKVGKQAMVPAALGTGFFAATVGGGSMLMGPAYLASGLRTNAFVAACALTSVTMHLFRIPAYAMGGWMTSSTITGSVVLALALVMGNIVGQWCRRGLSERVSRTMTYGTLVGGAATATLFAF